MTDKRTLSTEEIRDADLTDWRQLAGQLKARFKTGKFVTGLEFVNRIGAMAEAANHHPDITLTYPEVLVALVSHDAGGITSRDIDLARQISAVAAELGIGSDSDG